MKISLESKLVLTALVLAQSKVETALDYMGTTNLAVTHLMTPEVLDELKLNKLIDAFNMPTELGVWFTYAHGVSDTPPQFIKFVKSLSIKAQAALTKVCIGELAARATTTSSSDTEDLIKDLLDDIQFFFLGQRPSTKDKSIAKIHESYNKFQESNSRKIKSKVTN